MKVVQIELPDKMAIELEEMVKNGWFTNEAEIIRLALLEFLRHDRFSLQQQFQLEDIAWAVGQKDTTS